MNPIAERLATAAVLVTDGGLATCLQAKGCVLDDALWSASVLADDPESVAAVHRDFALAGADIVATATYQATVDGLRRHGLSEARAHEVIGGAGALARAAVGPGPLIAGSVGPYGASLADGSEYRGDYGLSEAALRDFHRARLPDLAQGVDLLACETIPSLVEGRVLARLVAEVGVPAWVSFSVRDDGHCSHGEPIEECVAAVADAEGVVAVGVNCFDPAWGEALVGRIAAVTPLPVVVYPNSGERWHDHRWHGEATKGSALVAAAARWHRAGARIIGGCCRTGPDEIAALRRWADGLPMLP